MDALAELAPPRPRDDRAPTLTLRDSRLDNLGTAALCAADISSESISAAGLCGVVG